MLDPSKKFSTDPAVLDLETDEFINTAAAALACADLQLVQHLVVDQAFIVNSISAAPTAEAALEIFAQTLQLAINAPESRCQGSSQVTKTILERMRNPTLFADLGFQAFIAHLEPATIRAAINVTALHTMADDNRIAGRGRLPRILKRLTTIFLGPTVCTKLNVQSVVADDWMVTDKINMDKNNVLFYNCRRGIGTLLNLRSLIDFKAANNTK